MVGACYRDRAPPQARRADGKRRRVLASVVRRGTRRSFTWSAKTWAATRSSGRSAWAAWAPSIWPCTARSAGRSRSRSSTEFADRPTSSRASSPRRAPPRHRSPAIVSVFDFETDPQGQPYIVMEYLAGETLSADLERRGPLPSLDAVTITRASPRRSPRRTPRASSTATSSPTTSSSAPAGRDQAARLRHRQAHRSSKAGQQSRTHTGR